MYRTWLPWGPWLRCPQIPLILIICPQNWAQIPLILITTHYYTLLHITTYITIIEPGKLARIMDNRMWFAAHLQDTSGKGGSVRFFPLPPSWGGCLWFGLKMRGPSRSAIAVATHPSLQPWPRQHWFKQRGWRRLPYVLREFLGAGMVPLPPEVKWSVACDCQTFVITHYYT